MWNSLHDTLIDWGGDLAIWIERTVPGLLGAVGAAQLSHLGAFAAVFVVLALLSWARFEGRARTRTEGRSRVASFLRFLFPPRVYVCRSTWVDVQMIVLNRLASPVSMGLALLLAGALAVGTSEALTRATGWDPRLEADFLSIAAITVSLALTADFATYFVHRLHHEIPALWVFHRVHHSAEVMTPLTAFRKHPMYVLTGRLMKAALIGPLQGIVFFLFAGPVDLLEAMGTNAVFAAFHVGGAALRHSHIWLSYGPVIERVLISPAQHQIHHSRARRHWDRNFGEVFALWDWLFGTLYLPKTRERLEFGADDATSVDHSGLTGSTLRPFADAWRVARGHARSP